MGFRSCWHIDGANEPGYRLREYHRIDKFAQKQFPDASTHSRIGDWKVTRVEEYKTESPSSDFDAIVVCYCQYSPISTALEPLPNIQDSQKLQEV